MVDPLLAKISCELLINNADQHKVEDLCFDAGKGKPEAVAWFSEYSPTIKEDPSKVNFGKLYMVSFEFLRLAELGMDPKKYMEDPENYFKNNPLRTP